METKIIYRTPVGNPERKYRQDKFIISTFKAKTEHVRRGIELCKELGFNMVEFGWVNPEESFQCITACEETGLDGIFQNWDFFGGFQESKGKVKVDIDKLKAYIAYTKKFRHVAGYYVWDEPLEEDKIQAAAEQVALMEALDPERLPFTVAIPSYNTMKTWKNQLFEGYLRQYTEVIKPAVLSLDYYPFRPHRVADGQQLDDSELFLDIALLRRLSLEKNIPMWFYFQTLDSPPTCGYEKLTPEQVRVQQYNALLHGAKGLQNYNVYNGAIMEDSTRGPLFYFTKDINYRCHQLGKTFMALTSVGIYHAPEVLRNHPAFDAYRESTKDSKVLAAKDLPFRCSVGEFEDIEGNRYLFVQNRDIYESRNFDLELKDTFRIYEVSQEDGMQFVREEAADHLEVKLCPGDAVLLRLQPAEEKAYLIDYVLQK